MPLTRHFYVYDEVRPALTWKVTNNNIQESLFWCKELIDSGYIGEVISTLFEAWLWSFGSMRIRWLINAWLKLRSDELTEDDIILACYQLATIPKIYKDSSLWNILVLSTQGDKSLPDRVTAKTPSGWDLNSDPASTFFVRALYQGKAQSAWWIAEKLDDNVFWSTIDWYYKNITKNKEIAIVIDAVKNYNELLGYKSEAYQRAMKCMLVLLLSSPDQVTTFIDLPSEIDSIYIEHICDWNKLIGRKNRRKYSVPCACLYGTTMRSQMEYGKTTLPELYNIEKGLIGCPFWDEAIAEHNGTIKGNRIKWNTDEDMERFYDTHFPDDIPDEWALKDKELSHGCGMGNNNPNIREYSSKYMECTPRLAWGTTDSIHKCLNKLTITECDISKVISNESSKYLQTNIDEGILRPVKKIKRVVYV